MAAVAGRSPIGLAGGFEAVAGNQADARDASASEVGRR